MPRARATFRARARAKARVKPIRKPSWLRPQPAGAPEASLSARACLRLPQAPASLGQPAAPGRAGRPHRAWFRNRRTCGRQGRQGAHAAATRAPARPRQGRREAPVDARVLHPSPGAGGAHGPWRLGVSGGCGRSAGVPPREREPAKGVQPHTSRWGVCVYK